jgi:hypothetical protein
MERANFYYNEPSRVKHDDDDDDDNNNNNYNYNYNIKTFV